MAVQKVRAHRRNGRGIKGYTRRKRPKSLKIVKRIGIGTYKIFSPVNKYGEHLGTRWVRVK